MERKIDLTLMPALLSKSQVARLTGRDLGTVTAAIENGDLILVQFGGRKYVTRESVEGLLAGERD